MTWTTTMRGPVLAALGLVAGLVVSGCDNQLPAPNPTRPADGPPTQTTPKRTPAEEKRAAAIQDTLKGIRQECQRAANGDWDQWERQLGGFQAELKNKIAAAKPFNPKAEGFFEARAGVLEGRDNFPLFESAPDWYVRYLAEPESIQPFRKEQPVVAAVRWLRSRGIDVIFVPVPKMTEVYPDQFADNCPPDRIVAPHVRRTLHDLLAADVEVVDLLPLFQEARDQDPAPLYLPADPHWNPRGKAIAAKALAARLKRYECVATAMAGPQTWVAAELPFPPPSDPSVGPAFAALTPAQQQRALASQPRTQLVIRDRAGAPMLSDTSPVVFIGDSFNGGVIDMVSKEINLPIHLLSGAGQTTQAFKEFVRDPDLLKDCKVVVWVNCNTSFQNAWPLPQVVKDNRSRDR